MNKNDIIDTVPFQVVIMKYFETFMQMFGENKLKEIADKINNSSTVKKVIKWAQETTNEPFAKEYLEAVHQIPYFIFSKAEIHTTAAIIMLGKWKVDVGDKQALCSDMTLNETLFSIIEKGEATKINRSSNTGNESLFNRFRKELSSYIESGEYEIINNQLSMSKSSQTADSEARDIINTLKRGEGSVGKFATTYAGFYVDAFKNNPHTINEEALRHVIFLYLSAKRQMGNSIINTEQLIGDSEGCLAQLIFCLLCEDKEIFDVFSSGSEIGHFGIAVVYDCTYEAGLRGVRATKQGFRYWAHDYIDAKRNKLINVVQKDEVVKVEQSFAPKVAPINTERMAEAIAKSLATLMTPEQLADIMTKHNTTPKLNDES